MNATEFSLDDELWEILAILRRYRKTISAINVSALPRCIGRGTEVVLSQRCAFQVCMDRAFRSLLPYKLSKGNGYSYSPPWKSHPL